MSNLKDAIILVVDDDSEYQEIHRRRLETRVEKLIIVGNRAAALHQIERQFFHAAILDIRLVDKEIENTEGMELARKLHSLGESTGIVIVSGYGTSDRVRTAFRKFGAVDFLDKALYTSEQFYSALVDATSIARDALEQQRIGLSVEEILSAGTFATVMNSLDFRQKADFERVLPFLVRPLLPVMVQHRFEYFSSSTVLETKYWSRYSGCGYSIRVGPRPTIQGELDELRQSGVTEDERYTIGKLSGYRCIDYSFSPKDFS